MKILRISFPVKKLEKILIKKSRQVCTSHTLTYFLVYVSLNTEWLITKGEYHFPFFYTSIKIKGPSTENQKGKKDVLILVISSYYHPKSLYRHYYTYEIIPFELDLECYKISLFTHCRFLKLCVFWPIKDILVSKF